MDKQRRLFLKNTAKASVGGALAFGFGSSLADELEQRNSKKIALVYASRYGSTLDTAKWVVQGTGKEVDLVDIEKSDPASLAVDYDTLILGSGVWTGGPHSRLRAFTRNYAAALKDKVLAVFVVCGTEPTSPSSRKRIDGYLQQIVHPLEEAPAFQTSLGGRIIVEQLNEQDKAALTRFYREFMKKELHSWDKTSPEKAGRFGASLKDELELESGFSLWKWL